jgi:hypothetical protein
MRPGGAGRRTGPGRRSGQCSIARPPCRPRPHLSSSAWRAGLPVGPRGIGRSNSRRRPNRDRPCRSSRRSRPLRRRPTALRQRTVRRGTVPLGRRRRSRPDLRSCRGPGRSACPPRNSSHGPRARSRDGTDRPCSAPPPRSTCRGTAPGRAGRRKPPPRRRRRSTGSRLRTTCRPACRCTARQHRRRNNTGHPVRTVDPSAGSTGWRTARRARPRCSARRSSRRRPRSPRQRRDTPGPRPPNPAAPAAHRGRCRAAPLGPGGASRRPGCARSDQTAPRPWDFASLRANTARVNAKLGYAPADAHATSKSIAM